MLLFKIYRLTSIFHEAHNFAPVDRGCHLIALNELVLYMLSNDFLRDVDGEMDHGSELFTFAGDRINRTLAKLISIYGLGKASSNYKSVIIKPFDSGLNVNIDSIMTSISDLKHKSAGNTDLFLRKLDENTSPVFFSKFGKCLPNHLTAATLAERSYNFQGLIDELNTNQMEIFAT